MKTWPIKRSAGKEPTLPKLTVLKPDSLKNLPPLYGQEKAGKQAVAHVKLFCPANEWEWYLTEYDPNDQQAFGLVCGWENELGYVYIPELIESGHVYIVSDFVPQPLANFMG